MTIFCLDFIVLRSQLKNLVNFPRWVKLLVGMFCLFICPPAVKVVSAEWKYNIFSLPSRKFNYCDLRTNLRTVLDKLFTVAYAQSSEDECSEMLRRILFGLGK